MSDSLTRLTSHVLNGQGRKLLTVTCPHSNLVVNVLHLLTRHGFIRGFRRREHLDANRIELQVLLKYKNAKPAISTWHSFSKRQRGKPCARMERRCSPPTKGTISIQSTPLGILEQHEAEHHRVGGVVLCRVAS